MLVFESCFFRSPYPAIDAENIAIQKCFVCKQVDSNNHYVHGIREEVFYYGTFMQAASAPSDDGKREETMDEDATEREGVNRKVLGLGVIFCHFLI